MMVRVVALLSAWLLVFEAAFSALNNIHFILIVC